MATESGIEGCSTGGPGLFLGFFFRLRSHGLRVTPNQWITLIGALAKGLHGASLIGFYSLARSVLVRDESEFDGFDEVFAAHFRGLEAEVAAIEAEVLEWLREPALPFRADPGWRHALGEVDVEAMREELVRRLREQEERHDGGAHWVGTGGTSPFGHSGHHPGGIRVEGSGGSGGAVQVAAARRFREHRKDLVLDTRQLGMALKKLRNLERRGPGNELDLEGTIDRTARAGGELELVFAPPRQNSLNLLLAMDVGGSMGPYRHLVSRLFSAAHASRHFKSLAHVYFHNCVYTRVWSDAAFRQGIPLHELLRRFDRETRLVLVGDADMYPGELTNPFGSIDWMERNEVPGTRSLERLRDHFKHAAWLNPMEERLWNGPSVRLVQRIFPMYPLTIEGVERLAAALSAA